jgi:hypothetical protein
MTSWRKTLGTAALVASTVAMIGCGGRDTSKPDAGVPQPTQDAGSDAGTGGTDAGTDGGIYVNPDGGPVEITIAQTRRAPYRTYVTLKGVVINAVDFVNKGSQGDITANFWVVDPNNPTDGLWVEKFYQDTPRGYVPQVGDKVDVSGWFQTELPYEQFVASRQRLASEYRFNNAPGLLNIVKVATVTPPADNPVSPGTFGNADGGFGRPNANYAGSRVHIQGELTLVNPTPKAFQRVTADPSDPVYYGFEVTGGILVSNQKTYGESPTDGGPPRCDWQQLVRNDGGTVTFPNGIRGVWDTYTFAACEDGGTDIFRCRRRNGAVPGTDGGNWFTYVVYPQDCATDLVGVYDAGPQ